MVREMVLFLRANFALIGPLMRKTSSVKRRSLPFRTGAGWGRFLVVPFPADWPAFVFCRLTSGNVVEEERLRFRMRGVWRWGTRRLKPDREDHANGVRGQRQLFVAGHF
jgi:hypothetical protein